MMTSNVTFYFIVLDEVYGDAFVFQFKMAAIGVGAIQVIQQLHCRSWWEILFLFFFSDKWYKLFHNAQAGNNLLKEIAVLVGMSPFSEIILGLQPRDKRVMFHIPESKIIVSKTNHR